MFGNSLFFFILFSLLILFQETGKSVKNEKNNEKAANVVIRPVQELEKRRTGRKRYPLAGSAAESKPNSPAPSSHSM